MAATAAQRAWNGANPQVSQFLIDQLEVNDTDETEFDREVRRLKLQPWQFVSSVALRYWAIRNAKRRYVPEYLLNAWGMTVRFEFTDL